MTKKDIELPPLPVGTTSTMVHGAYYCATDMHDYARAAIKSDRQQQQLTLDGVYTQRNALAIAFAKAAIAAGWVAGRGFDSGATKGWSDDWRHVVYVDLPDGRQASWHMSPECVPLLDGLPEYTGVWDGTSIAQDAEWCRFSYDRQQRGEPVGYVEPVVIEWLTDTERTAAAQMGTIIHKAKTSEGFEPIYTAPHPAEPPFCEECGDGIMEHDPGICGTCYYTKYADCAGCGCNQGQSCQVCDPVLETAKVPSDAELVAWATEEQFFLFCDEDEFLDIARSILARYGNHHGEQTSEAAPKFGEEE